MAVDPRGIELKRLLQDDPGGPVVMLNLLRFVEGGREEYGRYLQALRSVLLPRHGGEVIFAGDGSTPLVAEDGQAWDSVLLVRYPSRRAFSELIADPDYQQVVRNRTAALSEAVLQATTPRVMPSQSVPGLEFLSHMSHWANPGGPDAMR